MLCPTKTSTAWFTRIVNLRTWTCTLAPTWRSPSKGRWWDPLCTVSFANNSRPCETETASFTPDPPSLPPGNWLPSKRSVCLVSCAKRRTIPASCDCPETRSRRSTNATTPYFPVPICPAWILVLGLNAWITTHQQRGKKRVALLVALRLCLSSWLLERFLGRKQVTFPRGDVNVYLAVTVTWVVVWGGRYDLCGTGILFSSF